jgi:hypothetical protein
MTVPTFSAESSLYRSAGHYAGSLLGSFASPGSVQPAIGTCGGAGQVCCPNPPGCAPPLVCNENGICRMPCGGAGQRCCDGQNCESPYHCNPNGICRDCGGYGEKCCLGYSCEPGLQCLGGTCGIRIIVH